MPYTLTREQRDALHAEAITELAEIGDLYLALENDDYRLAHELWRRYEPLLLLLDQIGWEPTLADDASVVEVAMPDAQLATAARRLTRVTLGRLRHQFEQQLERGPDAESARHSIAVIETCTSLLADVALLRLAADRVEG
ncbi:hypothetical protein [Conexibacter woesei]|uniref:Uncharacterized protein n=1 Tax=Conexibacter woesei (strain DSM 14684 / CCUG 47730 / CIP 108061 / JCM 11494 / NBRC 100937 / ID131577) TaxID=469383 RepID=D3F9G6_CONWI|nr:hypothetical protein [Conexibacter woesei]ADB49133.1 hypothetical protein Cwoe_0700 [Conexibacter woesei DSM 14684]